MHFALRNGGWGKNTLFVAATVVAGSIVSIPQAACSGVVREMIINSIHFYDAMTGSNYKLFLLTLWF